MGRPNQVREVMEKIDGKSMDLIQRNIQALTQLFPEIVTEGKINFEKLKVVLGAKIEPQKEKYEFTWHGKTQALKLAQTPSTGTLRPKKCTSKNWAETGNLYIEGDNLEVLKLLQKAYFGKIKVIYIDPPYNTGKDFVYKDDFRDNINNYKEVTNQATKTNTESSGRFHTEWLNMIYPRLKLARNLLANDGGIFISIDDNEFSNLKKICDEIFGELNYVGIFVKQSKVGGGSDSKHIVKEHEYCLLYAKNINELAQFSVVHEEEYLKRYKEKDETGRFFWDTYARPGLQLSAKDSLVYPIECPDGTVITKRWRRSKERFQKDLEEGVVRITQLQNGNWSVQFKQYLPEGKRPRSMTTNFGGTAEGKEDINQLFETDKVFSYPKSVNFLTILLDLIKDEDAIILDFFSGSATTAHAVIELNAKDKGNRKFIMVQLPELITEDQEAYNEGFKMITEIGKERIRRAGERIVRETGETNLDIGFKVFQLDSSNIKTWDPDSENLERDIFDLQDNMKAGRSREDLLFEILLKIGIPITIPLEEVDFNGKTINNIGNGSVLLCLENEIGLDIVHEMIKLKTDDFDTKVIFKETGFLNDSVKTNALQTLKKAGITDVRCV
jgi:adenine-specific DNA-methyltransferase